MYVCECGREFEKSQSYIAHCGHCKTHLGDRYSKEKHSTKYRISDTERSWSKGLTKYTDERIKKQAEKIQGRVGSFFGRHHTEETKNILSEVGRYNASNHLNGWKSGNSKIQNKYEKFVTQFLIENGIDFVSEVVIPKKELSEQETGYYQLDFLVNGVIDLEIDGSSHNLLHDEIRDSLLSRKYTIYRIRHNDSIEELRNRLEEFVAYIKN